MKIYIVWEYEKNGYVVHQKWPIAAYSKYEAIERTKEILFSINSERADNRLIVREANM